MPTRKSPGKGHRKPPRVPPKRPVQEKLHDHDVELFMERKRMELKNSTAPVSAWWPGYYTEAHRRREHGLVLATELTRWGVNCDENPAGGTQVIFCGSIESYRQVEAYARTLTSPPPVVHYNWDIYPFQVDGPRADYWRGYLEFLKHPVCKDILVPSRCTIARTKEYTGRPATVLLSSVRPWDIPVEPRGCPPRRSYVLDVMRKYDDPNKDVAARACRTLGIPIIETRTTEDWDKFRWLVANARLLISPNYEASTGGLTLLEGYCHGVPVLLSNSPRNGAVDYFGARGNYFQWDSFPDLLVEIQRLWRKPEELDPAACRAWVVENYSEQVFAEGLAARLRLAAGRKPYPAARTIED